MTYRIKVPAKTLQVDEAHLLSGLEHALIYLQEYKKPMLVGAGVLLLAAGVVGGVFWYDRQASQKAQDLESEATRVYMGRPTSDPQKAETQLKLAIEQYRKVIEQYPRTPSAPLALFHLGNALVQSNDFAAAIEAYQRFITLYGSHPSLTGLAQQRLAYTHLLKGDRERAAKAFTTILESPGALNKDQALFELARLEEAQSRPEGALAHYQELIKTYPNSPYTSEAMIRTKLLDTKKTSESAPPASSPADQKSSSAPAQKRP
ncbi:MAG TPA: tetratricopeptide repeat protein [Nitrospira sp.]|nr:tetratricopeptide repeat protein [Nitrospira sp.]